MAAEGRYNLLWMVFICSGLVAVVLYTLIYPADKRRFPALYKGIDN